MRFCNDYAVKQQKEPLISTEIPTRPWSMVAQDFFTFDQKSYPITVDFYSDFWELDTLTDTSSETIVAHTKVHFARYCIPDKVITDNGPQFHSQILQTSRSFNKPPVLLIIVRAMVRVK